MFLGVLAGYGDQGTLRAPAAMYQQPRRAFRLANSLREWWRATNGIP